MYMEKRCPGRAQIEEDSKTMTVQEIADKYEVLRQTARAWLKKYQLYTPRTSPYPGDKQFLEDCKTMTGRKIAEKYNVSTSTVDYWRTRCGAHFSNKCNTSSKERYEAMVADVLRGIQERSAEK